VKNGLKVERSRQLKIDNLGHTNFNGTYFLVKLARTVAQFVSGYIASSPVRDVAEVESRAGTHHQLKTLEKRLR
jgi:hypothetical protein